MQKHTAPTLNPYPFGESALAASRNFWLAGLGATVVTRDWVQTEGDRMFRTLVREGTVVESRAIRFVGDQVETSIIRANAAWKRTRRTVESGVKKAATTVVDLAQQVLPKSLPAIELPKAFAPAAKPMGKAGRARKAPATRKARPVKKAKRTKRA